MLNLKGLTCQGGSMNPLEEHHHVLGGFKLWYHFDFDMPLYMMGAVSAGQYKFEGG